MGGRAESSSYSAPPAAPKSIPVPLASSVPEQTTGRVEPLSSSTSQAASGSSPANACSSRESPAPSKAKPSDPLQKDATAASVAAVVSHPQNGRSSTSCFSGTVVPLRADTVGIRSEALGCFGRTSLFAGSAAPEVQQRSSSLPA